MKLLIAFAVFAAAFAADKVQVVQLPAAPAPAFEQRPDIRPEIVPQSVLEALKTLPVLPVKDNADLLRVNFVDAPVNMDKVTDNTDEYLKVNFVDAPLETQNVPQQSEIPHIHFHGIVNPVIVFEIVDPATFVEIADPINVLDIAEPVKVVEIADLAKEVEIPDTVKIAEIADPVKVDEIEKTDDIVEPVKFSEIQLLDIVKAALRRMAVKDEKFTPKVDPRLR